MNFLTKTLLAAASIVSFAAPASAMTLFEKVGTFPEAGVQELWFSAGAQNTAVFLMTNNTNTTLTFQCSGSRNYVFVGNAGATEEDMAGFVNAYCDDVGGPNPNDQMMK